MTRIGTSRYAGDRRLRGLSPYLWYVAFLSFARRPLPHTINFTFLRAFARVSQPTSASGFVRVEDIVLALITVHAVHTAEDFIERERRRPSKTSTNAAVARKSFGDEVRKKIMIPRFIDDYSYPLYRHLAPLDRNI